MKKKQEKQNQKEQKQIPKSLYELVKEIALFVDRVDKENIDKK